MSWWVILALAAGVSGQRLAGMFWAGPFLTRRPALARLGGLLPMAVIAGVIAQLCFASSSTSTGLTVDARAVGLAVAAVAVWRRAPLIVVVLAAAAATALARAVG